MKKETEVSAERDDLEDVRNRHASGYPTALWERRFDAVYDDLSRALSAHAALLDEVEALRSRLSSPIPDEVRDKAHGLFFDMMARSGKSAVRSLNAVLDALPKWLASLPAGEVRTTDIGVHTWQDVSDRCALGHGRENCDVFPHCAGPSGCAAIAKKMDDERASHADPPGLPDVGDLIDAAAERIRKQGPCLIHGCDYAAHRVIDAQLGTAIAENSTERAASWYDVDHREMLASWAALLQLRDVPNAPQAGKDAQRPTPSTLPCDCETWARENALAPKPNGHHEKCPTSSTSQPEERSGE